MRLFKIILFAVLPFVISAQSGAAMMMSGQSVTASADSLLNEFGTNVYAAFSVFQLDVNVDTFGTITCQLDNAEHHILFSGGVYDTAEVKTQCGSGHAYLTRWFDPVFGNHAVNDTANAPVIMRNGEIVRGDTGRPGLRPFRSISGLSTISPYSISSGTVSRVIAVTEQQGNLLRIFQDSDAAPTLYWNGDDIIARVNISSRVNNLSQNTTYLTDAIYDSTVSLYVNGTLGDSDAQTYTGWSGNANILTGEGGILHEVLIYTTDVSSQIDGIRNNINDRYNIY